MPLPDFHIGIRPKGAEVYSAGNTRVCQVILPRNTRAELAERAVREAVQKWIEKLDTKQHLRLSSGVEIEGPYSCPFLPHFGEDLWLAKGRFWSTRPRLVPEDVLVAQRRLAEEVGVPYEDYRTQDVGALPDDHAEQLAFVAQNEDAVEARLRQVEKMHRDGAADEYQGV